MSNRAAGSAKPTNHGGYSGKKQLESWGERVKEWKWGQQAESNQQGGKTQVWTKDQGLYVERDLNTNKHKQLHYTDYT